jgi:hypothetical protein
LLTGRTITEKPDRACRLDRPAIGIIGVAVRLVATGVPCRPAHGEVRQVCLRDAINMQTAKVLGVDIPNTLIAGADEVIE